MSAPEPNSEAPAPVMTAKRRLPFAQDAGAARHPGVTAAAAVYIVAALAALGAAGYMHLVRHEAILSVPVLAPALGGFYFFIRTLMIVRPQANPIAPRTPDAR